MTFSWAPPSLSWTSCCYNEWHPVPVLYQQGILICLEDRLQKYSYLKYQGSVCMCICTITCAIVMSHTLLLTLVDLMAALQFEYSTGVASMCSLARLSSLRYRGAAM